MPDVVSGDSVAAADALASVLVKGGAASDAVALGDSLLVELLSLGADVVAMTDGASAATSYGRVATDALGVSDSLRVGDEPTEGETIDGGNDGEAPVYARTIDTDGPVTASGVEAGYAFAWGPLQYGIVVDGIGIMVDGTGLVI